VNTLLTVLSLGAGVQSTTLALMAAHGEITPMPDCAIFADTGWEPKAVYDHLRWLMSPNVLPFPVHRVGAGNIRADILAKTNSTGQRFASVPWFTLSPKGRAGMGRRQCTKEYKLEPIYRECRRLAGPSRKARATVLIGISTDEGHRMRPARRQWITNCWPLIELGVSRRDCLRWLELHGYPEPPKSACIGCPFHNDDMWREMRDKRPDEWADALAVDAAIRKPHRGIVGEQFMHAARIPLGQVDLRTDAERGQLNLFGNECEGICGV
jgi:hypothetical protein